MSAGETAEKVLDELTQLVGGDRAKAAHMLNTRLRANVNPLEVIELKAKVDVLLQYLEDGSRVKKKEIATLAERQTSQTLYAHLNAIKKDLGIT